MAEGKSVLEHVGALVGIAAAVAALTAYCVSLQFSLNEADKEINRLSKQIESLSSQVQSQVSAKGGLQGPKGDQGDAGPQGPKGERGPQGEQGPAAQVDVSQFRPLVDQLVSQKFASMPQSAPAMTAQTIAAVPDIFNSSSCIPIDTIRNLDVLTLRSGNEFCDKTGRLLFRVSKIGENDGLVSFANPGNGNGYCSFEETCKFSDIGKTFVYERRGHDDNGEIALFRIKR
jgi:hypothetical protein